jgi:hypothetical protein
MEGIGRGLIEIYPGIYLEGQRTTTKYLSQDSHCDGRDSEAPPPEYG